MPTHDQILEELHAIRDTIAKSNHDDLREMAESARLRQAASGHQIVRLPPKHFPSAKKAS